MRNLLALVVLSGALVGILKYEDERYHFRDTIQERVQGDVYAEGKPSVLFIGNSFTSVNDLPRTFAKLARSLGENVGVGGYAPGGQSFDGHSKDPAVAKLISSREWDYVVLQEQSQRPAFAEQQVQDETIAPAMMLVAMIRRAHRSSKVVFYETWGRKNGDQDNCKSLPDICTYDGQQKRLDESYALMAQLSGSLLVPVGEAWAKVRAAHPEIELYAGDGVHPSPQGTYLAACVFYATLFHKKLTGADRVIVSEAQAQVLQKAAEEACLGPT